jgi:hypothetical protein
LLAELATQPWTPVTPIDVTVRDGVVHLAGVVTDERQREALRVAAENIPGVRKVEDYITPARQAAVWVEPQSRWYPVGLRYAIVRHGCAARSLPSCVRRIRINANQIMTITAATVK